jgi:hypothetical protein
LRLRGEQVGPTLQELGRLSCARGWERSRRRATARSSTH